MLMFMLMIAKEYIEEEEKKKIRMFVDSWKDESTVNRIHIFYVHIHTHSV